jgi:hypothetical protein
MSNLQRNLELKIVIGSVERTYNITFPKVGDYINVEARKAQLTVPKNSIFDQSTQYLNMIRQGTIASNLALDLVDLIAWFEVCIPDLMKNAVGELSSIEELDLFDAKPLLEIYRSKFLPWKNAWEAVFQGLNKEEEKKEEVKAESK